MADMKTSILILLSFASLAAAAADSASRMPDGKPFWNGSGYARRFMYPPAFEFGEVSGAKAYRFEVYDDTFHMWTFTADRPTAAIPPEVWQKIPENVMAAVFCFGLDANGKDCGRSLVRGVNVNGDRFTPVRGFFKTASFKPGTYPKAKRSYAEASRMAFDYVFNLPYVRHFRETGKPDGVYWGECYPSKIDSSLINAMITYAEICPERAKDALLTARRLADYLLSISEPEGAPLAHLPPTYWGEREAAKQYKGQTMLLYPAAVARTYADLFAATKDTKYLAAAERIAEWFLRNQGEDGSWYLKLWLKDGSPVAPNRCLPFEQMGMFDRLFALTKKPQYAAASERAFKMIDDGPLQDWNWEGQFEDCEPRHKYFNLTKHNACAAAIFLSRHWPTDAHRRGQVRDILRWAEDQFIVWERPCHADGIGNNATRPADLAPEKLRKDNDYLHWHVPAVLEQYGFAVPIDASSAKLINTYLAAYAADPNPLYLEKARTLGDSMTNIQHDNGCIPTHWVNVEADPKGYRGYEKPGDEWVNCLIASARALANLAAASRAEGPFAPSKSSPSTAGAR